MQKQKIAHLTSVHPALDVRIFTKQCVSLAKAGFDVTLIAPYDKDEVRGGVKIKSIKKQNHSRIFRMIFTALRVFIAAWRKNAKIYHFHDPELIPFAMLLRLKGAKIIYDVHEDAPRQIMNKQWIPVFIRYPIAKILEFLEWLSCSFFFSGIVAATPQIAKRFPKKKTVIVQNFPILSEFFVADKQTDYEKRKQHAIYIGAIAKIRGIFEMVNALERVKCKEAKLQVAGVMQPKELEGQLKSLEGYKKVDYLGWQNRQQISYILANSKLGLVVLHPKVNYMESYPVKLFEYMAAGLPMVVSDFSFWRKIIGEYKCAIFVDPLDSEAIANAMDWIFSNPNEAKEMGQRGLKAVKEKYNWQQQELVLLELYENLLHKGRG